MGDEIKSTGLVIKVMREEASQWLAQAKHELNAAEKMFEARIYDVCCFLCHQASEKALKAVVIEVKRIPSPHTHELMALGKQAGAKELDEDLKELNPHFMTSRYPDAANAVPALAYSEKIASDCLKIAEKVVSWSTKTLGK